MPVFVHKNGFKVFFAHVPKTGGTYIEDFFVQNGFECFYRSTENPRSATKLAPQHYHRDIFEQIVKLDEMDWKIISVRHPVERLLSQYRDTRAGKAGKDFIGWLDGIDLRLDETPGLKNNHFRPQIDFFRPDLEIQRQEGRFDREWAERIQDRFGLTLPRLVVDQRRDTGKGADHSSLDEAALRHAMRFCKKRYPRDFEMLGYDMEDSPSLQAAGLALDKTMRPLTSWQDRGATVTGRKQHPEKRALQHAWQSGVVTADGNALPVSMIRRRKKLVLRRGDTSGAAKFRGKALYAGVQLNGYGHFLLESLSRLWYLDEHPDPDLPILFSARQRAQDSSVENALKSYQRQLLDLLKVPNPVVLVGDPVIPDETIVPEPGFEIEHFFHPAQARFLERGNIPHRPLKDRRIWISRSKLKDTTTMGIEPIEDRLEKEGWIIMHPQLMPVREQIEMLASAERLAGEEGSALHSLVLMSEMQGMVLDVFPRSAQMTQTYWTIAERKGFTQRSHDLGPPKRLWGRKRNLSKSYHSLDRILEVLL